jgi:hypothetical protein
MVNTGKNCTGLGNTGSWNTGDHNTGHYNTGHYNTGNYNTGHYNTGNYNTGDWNLTSFSSGCFNTKEPEIYMFDKPSGITYRKWLDSEAKELFDQIPRGGLLDGLIRLK